MSQFPFCFMLGFLIFYWLIQSLHFLPPSEILFFVLEPTPVMEMGSFQLKNLTVPIVHLHGVMAKLHTAM